MTSFFFIIFSGLRRGDGDPMRHRTLHGVRDAGEKMNKKASSFLENQQK